MKKYPVISEKGNEYLVKVKLDSDIGYIVFIKKELKWGLFHTVYKHYAGHPVSLINEVKNAVFAYEFELVNEIDRLKPIIEFEEWDGKIE